MAYDPQKITFFAETDARGKRQKFGIKAEDRTRHVYVIGKTGMGKSTLLENMAVQDIQNGEGMAFIDPHGSTAEKLLEYIPEHRVKDVLYFAPFDMESPVSFNVMEDVGHDKRHLVVSGLMSTFKKIWVDAWSARMEYILSNTLLALLEYPDSTLLGVNRMLSDKDYRKAVVDNIKDPSVKSFWVDEFAKYNERYMQEAGDAIKNKIGQFTANPLIRNIIGQPTSSFDVRQFMDERKILIVNLSKGLIGETNANLLGSMLITRIYLSAMSRADLPANAMKSMPNFYFYVDEFQSFANEAFANILSEARKYKLNLTIAHQYIEQMEEEVRNAVFGNVGTTIAFRVGPFDAEVLETVFSPEFLATDIVNLGFAQVYLTLMIDGIGSRPFSAVTLPPIPQSKISYKDMVIAESRKQYAKPRAEIEENIRIWHIPLPKPVSASAVKAVVSQAPRAVEKEAPAPQQKTEQKSEVPPERVPFVQTPVASVVEEKERPLNVPESIPRVATPNVLHTTSKSSESRDGRNFERRNNRPPQRFEGKYGKKHDGEKEARKEKSAADLKVVLQNLARPAVQKPPATPDGEGAKQDLKSALAAVMKVPPQQKAEVREEQNRTQVATSSVPVSAVPAPASHFATVAASPLPEPVPERNDERATLAKLERILKGR